MSENSVGFQPHPIGDILLDGVKFDPQDDITPKEVALITQMFIIIISGMHIPRAHNEFIQKHNLERHFTPVIEVPSTEIIV